MADGGSINKDVESEEWRRSCANATLEMSSSVRNKRAIISRRGKRALGADVARKLISRLFL